MPRASFIGACTILVATLSTGVGCSSGGTGGAGGGGAGGSGGGSDVRPPEPDVTVDLQGRAYDVKVPAGYDGSTPAPLVVMLHGYTNANTTMSPGADMDAYMGMSKAADPRGIVVAIPRGSLDPMFKKYFWNGTDSCCDINHQGTNDIGYLLAMIDEIKAKYSIDDKRIFAVGHSNGGFMAHRVACDRASVFAGIVSLAGMPYKNPDNCAASAPIAVLHVHGDADPTIKYEGGAPLGIVGLPLAPGAEEAAQMWAKKNRCKTPPDTSAAPIDLVTDLAGAETRKTIYDGCEANGATELWTIQGGVHSPAFNGSWADTVLDFLMAHPKP